jgi:hypothetical protein
MRRVHDPVMDKITSEQGVDARDVAAAINRGSDEYGRPNPLPFDPANMIPIGDPRISTEMAGLRQSGGDVGSELIPQPPLRGPVQVGGQLAANMRPSDMIEDRRKPAYVPPSTLMKRDWLTSALDEAVRPDPEADDEFSQELTRNKNLPGRSSR